MVRCFLATYMMVTIARGP